MLGNKSYAVKLIEPVEKRKKGVYEKIVKRTIDVVCALMAIICFSPLYVVIAILVRVKLGTPVIFSQKRPGLVGHDGKERIFKMYKFRTMTDERDNNGRLLPDEKRLTKFGEWLRKTSLDELPEAFNILNGTMSVIGPRPQLVRDLVFMTKEQRMRHSAKPGLSGLAQVNGRNLITWEEKLQWDLQYTGKVTFFRDVVIVLKTVVKAFVKKEGIAEENCVTAMDYGDYLLKNHKISEKKYCDKQKYAESILEEKESAQTELDDRLVSVIMPTYNGAKYIASAIKSVLKQTYKNWELIIIDDCSTDNTYEIINEVKDSRIRIFRNEKNRGAAISRNKGIREAKGRWLAFLDSDDIWEEEKMEKQLKFMLENNYSFTYTDYRIQLNGKWLPYKCTAPDMVNKRRLYNYCYFFTTTVMYDQKTVGLIQIADLKKNNDYAMWLKAIEKTKCYRLPECLAYYIKHNGSISDDNKIKLIKWHYRLYRKGQDKTPLAASILTLNNLFFGVIKKIRYKEKIQE